MTKSIMDNKNREVSKVDTSKEKSWCRRGFIREAMSFGGVFAVSGLSVSAADNPAVFPKRGQFERLVLNFETVEIGLEKPFSVLHISDTHLTAAYPHEPGNIQEMCSRRTQTFGGRQEEALQDSLEWAKSHADYVIHTGDLIDWQSEANFDLVKKYFGEEMTGCLGNHEYCIDLWNGSEKHTEEWKGLTRKKIQSAYPFNASLHSQIVNGVNFVTLDDVYGYVTEGQFVRFREEAAKGLPIVLCMHVPFYSDRIWRTKWHYWGWKGKKFRSAAIPEAAGDCLRQRNDAMTQAFFSYLKKEPLLKAILSGHLHMAIQDRFSDTAMQYVVGGNFMFHGQEILFV